MGMNKRRSTLEMLDFCRRLDLPVVSSRFNTANPVFSFQPLDRHPNELAHRIYAAQLIEALEEAGI